MRAKTLNYDRETLEDLLSAIDYQKSAELPEVENGELLFCSHEGIDMVIKKINKKEMNIGDLKQYQDSVTATQNNTLIFFLFFFFF